MSILLLTEYLLMARRMSPGLIWLLAGADMQTRPFSVFSQTMWSEAELHFSF